jgi:hypothetical protein
MESDNIKFRINVVQGLLVKHLVQRKISGHHVGENTVKRLTVPFCKKNTFHRKEMETNNMVFCLQQACQNKR